MKRSKKPISELESELELSPRQLEVVDAVRNGAGYLELVALMAKQEGKKVMFDYLVIGKLAGIIKILTKESVEGK